MGENFLSKQAKGFRTRNEAAKVLWEEPDLLSGARTERTVRQVVCEGEPPEEGETVVLKREGERVVVLCSNRWVGEVDVEDRAAVLPALGRAGVAMGSVGKPPPMQGLFTVEVADAEGSA